MRPDCDLRSCLLCQHCTPEWKHAIAAEKTTVSVKKGQPVFNEGDPVKGIFFINSGAVKVFARWTGDKELIIRFARQGDILGHRGIGDKHVYPVSAVALADSVICFIPNHFLDATLRVDQAFSNKLLFFYANELQKAEQRMRDLAHMDANARIAQALLDLSSVFGLDEKHFIKATITRQDIASYAGTTYETVFKFFNILSAKKVVKTTGKDIAILSKKQLLDWVASATAGKVL